MSRDDVKDAIAHIHMAHVVTLMALVKALEASGAMKREDFVRVLEISVEAMHARDNHEIADLVEDILSRFTTSEIH